jgi:carotenoid cleavage dioxygenase-like enzyme
MTYTAHPKIDPDTGFIYNIGTRKGKDIVDIYLSDKSGNIGKHNPIKFDRTPTFIHDICLAGDYLIFFTFPIKIDIFSILLNRKSMKDALDYDENSYSEIVIINKKTLELVTKIKHDPIFFFHFSNGFINEKGNLIFDLIEYDSFDIFKKYTSDILHKNFEIEEKKEAENLKEVNASFSRFEINLNDQKLISKNKILNYMCDFPVVHSNRVGKKYSKVFLGSTDENKCDYFKNAILMDIDSQTIIKKRFEDGIFPGEILHIENQEYRNEGKGYAITVAYDGNRDKSTVYLMNESTLEEVAVFDLPDLTAHGFHGMWKEASISI